MPPSPLDIPLPALTLAALRAGDGPRLLYLHDELDSGWTPFLDLLAESCEVVAAELPGYGGSPRPDDGADTVDDYAYLVADLVDALASDGPVALVGAGLGGWLAVEAVLRGARADALVAIGAPGVDIPGDPPADYFVLLPHERAALFFNDPAHAPDVDEDAAIRNESTTARLVWQPRYVNPALRLRLHRIRQPVLVLWGEDDRFLSRAHGEAIAQGVPHGELAVVPSSAAFPARENPAATAAHVSRFLRQLPQLPSPGRGEG